MHSVHAFLRNLKAQRNVSNQVQRQGLVPRHTSWLCIGRLSRSLGLGFCWTGIDVLITRYTGVLKIKYLTCSCLNHIDVVSCGIVMVEVKRGVLGGPMSDYAIKYGRFSGV